MNWVLCPVCKQAVHKTSMMGPVKKHECPERVEMEFRAMVDATVDFEMDDFENIVAGFWCEPDVKFLEYLAENGGI
jgi:hypothetical protein